jgi:hydrogenase nickel incorporation protein HypA/HybF
MHEMSLAEGVLQILEEHARKEGFARVKSVWLEIGELSGVEPQAMRFCFEAVTRDSVADGAALEIVATPGIGWCLQCGQSVPMRELFSACPQCGSYQLQATGGTEMRVKELEVE